jgi:hypothetical protein
MPIGIGLNNGNNGSFIDDPSDCFEVVLKRGKVDLG